MGSTQVLNDSLLDSTRFGIKVVRGYMPATTPNEDIINEVISCDADLVILRTDAGNSDAIVQLQRQGWAVIHADTLVYYGIDLATIPHEPLPKGIRLATNDDQNAIHEIAESSFKGYRAHYAANPLLPRDKILAGYVEWSKSRLTPASLGSCTWVVAIEEHIAGFATCDLSKDMSKVEIVLNAVHPQFSRRGLYRRLLKGILCHYAAQSYQRLIISTQLWNYTVQRQWTRAGLSLEQAYDTYHIDRRLRARETLL